MLHPGCLLSYRNIIAHPLFDYVHFVNKLSIKYSHFLLLALPCCTFARAKDPDCKAMSAARRLYRQQHAAPTDIFMVVPLPRHRKRSIPYFPAPQYPNDRSEYGHKRFYASHRQRFHPPSQRNWSSYSE